MTSPESQTETRIDPGEVARLYVRHAEELKAFLLGVLRDGDLAGEALQSTFTRTLEAGHTAREETLKGWLFRVAFNEAMQLRRRQAIDRKATRELPWRRPRGDDTEPEERLVRYETVDRVRQALETLPEEQRQVVRMRMYEDKTFAVIAEETGVPLGTVLTRMRLALQKLARRLDAADN